jgi:hypothetical protein
MLISDLAVGEKEGWMARGFSFPWRFSLSRYFWDVVSLELSHLTVANKQEPRSLCQWEANSSCLVTKSSDVYVRSNIELSNSTFEYTS